MEVTHSISFGQVNYKHNIRREGKSRENIDPSLTKYNVTLADEVSEVGGIKQYVNKMYQPYIDEFNAKQKRNDRKIKGSYIDWHKLNYSKPGRKMPPYVLDIVMQIGNATDFGRFWYKDHNESTRDMLIDFFKDALEQFKKDHPHLKVACAVIHFDEPDGTPHMHITVVPNVTERGVFKTSLQGRASLSKALELDGIERVGERSEALMEGFQMERFKEHADKSLEKVLDEHQISYKANGKSDHKHQWADVFKRLVKDAERTVNEAYFQLNALINDVYGKEKYTKVKVLTERVVKETEAIKDEISPTNKQKGSFIFGKAYKRLNEPLKALKQEIGIEDDEREEGPEL